MQMHELGCKQAAADVEGGQSKFPTAGQTVPVAPASRRVGEALRNSFLKENQQHPRRQVYAKKRLDTSRDAAVAEARLQLLAVAALLRGQVELNGVLAALPRVLRADDPIPDAVRGGEVHAEDHRGRRRGYANTARDREAARVPVP